MRAKRIGLFLTKHMKNCQEREAKYLFKFFNIRLFMFTIFQSVIPNGLNKKSSAKT